MSFTYDDSGIRTSKTVGNVKHSYYLNGSQIVAEQWSDKLLVYLYDASGTPIGMMYRTTSYAVNQWDVFWFEKNLQGDIVAVYNESGTKVVTYNYSDAWGNHTVSYTNGGVSTGAAYNPFRYRGYYYDTDLGMYYLQSRYYDAKVCRFINSDGELAGVSEDLQGYNLYAYCFNNPIMYSDHSGNWPKWFDNIINWFKGVSEESNTTTNCSIIDNVNYTSSTGINISLSPSAFVFNFQISFSIDAKGNAALQWAFSGGFTTGSPGASISVFNMNTNAPSIDHLEGMGYQIGGSAGIPVSGFPLMVGADVNLIPDSVTNEPYWGNTAYIGVGTPGVEGHVTWGKTFTISNTRFNIFGR